MDIFSSLNGKNHHLNVLQKLINTELANRIGTLPPSVEQDGFTIAFDAANKIIMNLFHADTGLFKTVIKQLEIDNMRKIYDILMLHILVDMCTAEYAVEGLEEGKAIKTAPIVFGITEDKVNELYSLFSDLQHKERIPLLWESICSLSNKDLRDSDSLYTFGTIYRDCLKEAKI